MFEIICFSSGESDERALVSAQILLSNICAIFVIDQHFAGFGAKFDTNL